MNQRQRTIFDETVSSRIEALLARCDKLKRGSHCDRPTRFNAAGAKHAAAIASADEKRHAKSAGQNKTSVA